MIGEMTRANADRVQPRRSGDALAKYRDAAELIQFGALAAKHGKEDYTNRGRTACL